MQENGAFENDSAATIASLVLNSYLLIFAHFRLWKKCSRKIRLANFNQARFFKQHLIKKEEPISY